MPDEKLSSIFAGPLALLKDVFTVARELLLLVLFVVLIFFPKTLNQRLTDANLSKIDLGFATWQREATAAAVNQSKAAAQANSAATESLSNVKDSLTTIAAQTTDPKAKALANTTIQKLDGSLSSLNAADQSIAHSIVTQQAILQTANAARPSASNSAPVTEGWVYLGEIDSAAQHWIIPPQPKIAATSPVPAEGQTITLTDDLYLRADRGPGQTFNQAAIAGAVRAGTAVLITQVQPSHALNGGQFIWARIKVTGNQ